jgi:hypothetical protein
VRVLPSLGTRELVDPALMVGLVQLVPEYSGSALEFVSLGRVPATASVTATAGALASGRRPGRDGTDRGGGAVSDAPVSDPSVSDPSVSDASVSQPPVAIRRGRRQRRPTGAPPPLPRRITPSTTAWLLVAAVVGTGTFLISERTPWLRIGDHASTWVLRQLAAVRTPWLTDLANWINDTVLTWHPVIVVALVLLVVVFRRWRHLAVLTACVFVLEFATGAIADGADVGNGRAVFWLDSDQAGRQALTITLTAACNTAEPSGSRPTSQARPASSAR